MRRILINGKQLGVPLFADPVLPLVVRDSLANLTWRRSLVLSYGESEDHSSLQKAIAKLEACGRSYGKSHDGLAKSASGKPILKPCGLRICPHCEQERRQGYADDIQDHLEGTPTSALGMLTLKMPSAKGAWPITRTLLPTILHEKEAYKGLQRSRALLTSRDGPFHLGVWRIHCRWDFNAGAWDVHRHLLVAGTCFEPDVNAIRLQWARLTGRHDAESVHYERRHDRGGSINYMSTELASVFSRSERPRRLRDQLHDAWSMAFNHHGPTAEYLWTLRQRPGNLIGFFGTSANSNSRDRTSPPARPTRSITS